MALPSLETPGQAHSGDSQMPRHTHRLNSFHFGGQTTPLFPSNSPAGELKLPYITAQNFAKGPTSLVDYSRTMVIDNRPVSVAPSFLVGWWKECVATYVYSPDLQQNLLHQIRSPAFFNFCLDRGLINAAVPVDTSLPVFERWPLVHPDRHPTVLVRMLNGGRFAVPYYGHSSIDCLDYMHLVKHLPQIRKEKIMYTIYEGLVKNLFHFETDKKKKLALARATSAKAIRYWKTIKAKNLGLSGNERVKKALIDAENMDTATRSGKPTEVSADDCRSCAREPPEPVELADHMDLDDIESREPREPVDLSDYMDVQNSEV